MDFLVGFSQIYNTHVVITPSGGAQTAESIAEDSPEAYGHCDDSEAVVTEFAQRARDCGHEVEVREYV